MRYVPISHSTGRQGLREQDSQVPHRAPEGRTVSQHRCLPLISETLTPPITTYLYQLSPGIGIKFNPFDLPSNTV